MFFNLNGNEVILTNQRFSSTDLCTNPDKLGIVYPYDADENIEKSYCVSSIIDYDNKDEGYLLKHTEVRDVQSKKTKLLYRKFIYATAYCIMESQNTESVKKTFKNDCLDYTENFILNSENQELTIKRDIYKEFQPLFFIDSNNIQENFIRIEKPYSNLVKRNGIERFPGNYLYMDKPYEPDVKRRY